MDIQKKGRMNKRTNGQEYKKTNGPGENKGRGRRSDKQMNGQTVKLKKVKQTNRKID